MMLVTVPSDGQVRLKTTIRHVYKDEEDKNAYKCVEDYGLNMQSVRQLHCIPSTSQAY